MAERISVQQALQAAFGEDPENLQVFQFEPNGGEAVLCRFWVRTGTCKWGAQCRHRHDLDLSRYSLRARRGAAMPGLVHGDPKAALESASENIAFVLCGERAVYDYEDHDAARRFLSAGMQGQDVWSLLPLELAIDTLWSAGAFGAVSATMSCKDWGCLPIAQGIRELAYADATGADFRNCSPRHLCDLMLTRRFMLSAQTLYAEKAKGNQGCGSACSACGPVVHVCQPSPVCLLFMDGSVTFALLHSGEVRCHRSSTGQILAQSQRLGKGRLLQAAALLGCEAFVLGDDQGGLQLLQRDDLSETQVLRATGKSSIAALAALQDNQQACLCASMDGSIELIQVSDEGDDATVLARIEPVGSLGELEGIPAISSYNLGNEDLAFFSAGASAWTFTVATGTLKLLEGRSKPAVSSRGCHNYACVLRSKTFVTASSGDSKLQWWQLERNGELVAGPETHSDGVILGLSGAGDLCAALHAYLTVTLWQGALRKEVLRITMSGLGHSLSLGPDGLAIASAPGLGRVRSPGDRCSLHLATLPLHVEKLVKEPKKSKPAKMFAQKTRGGRKNQKGKQSRLQ
ncbi:C3H1-type domain-containing protein [Durusdinium trenchii]|uniref:C3H1-type domain-containing protein n=2 Tax=Durusdinium trenchii TaxID=1381693 RepID=A0ABP0M162_9DINO